MSGLKAVVNPSHQAVEASIPITERSTAAEKGISPDTVVDDDAVAGVQGPTDVPDEARSRGIAHIFMMMCLIMAVSLVASNATILGTVCAAFCRAPRLMLTKQQAIPSITSEFNTVQDVGWYSAAYFISR